MKTSLSKKVNRIVNSFGFEIHRYIPYLRAGSLRSMYDVCMQAKKCGLEVNTVFDVGVASGTPQLYEAFSECEFFLIEPLSEFNDHIEDILKHYNGKSILAAASDKKDKMTIHVNHKNLDGTSLHSSKNLASKNIDARQIDTIRIDELVEEYNLSGPYVIKADVQGAELKVVEGASEILDQTEMIILETSFFEFSSSTPQFYDVITFMKHKGFVVYDFIGGAIRPYDGALGQIDVAFVKEYGKLRNSHEYGSY